MKSYSSERDEFLFSEVTIQYIIPFMAIISVGDINRGEFGEIMATTAYLVKKLGIMSVAKFGAIIGLIYGIIMGLVLAVAGGTAAASLGGSMGLGAAAGIGMFIGSVIMGVIFGFIGGAIVAFVYNFALDTMGGIEVDLEVKQ